LGLFAIIPKEIRKPKRKEKKMKTYRIVVKSGRDKIRQLFAAANVCAEEIKYNPQTKKYGEADAYIVDFSTLGKLPTEAQMVIMLVKETRLNKEQTDRITKVVKDRRIILVIGKDEALWNIRGLFAPKTLDGCTGIAV
jgi:hypothetical protein